MKNFRSQESGFMNILILFLLPLLIAILWGTSQFLGIVRHQEAQLHTCRTENIETQKFIAKNLSRLLRLNQQADFLYTQYLLANAALVAALATGTPPAIELARQRVFQVNSQRKSFDLMQKALIAQTNLQLVRRTQSTTGSLKRLSQQISQQFYFLKIDHSLGWQPLTTLSVEPTSGRIAPAYRTKADFTELQSVAHKWQSTISLRPPYSHYLNLKNLYLAGCRVSLKQEGAQWVPKIIRDKF